MIGRCLQSVAWADETIVMDSGSTDGTQDICRALGAKVIVTEDWPGPGPQRNRAIERASGDWILALDADELARSWHETRSAVSGAIPARR